jgi:hypothetical protein
MDMYMRNPRCPCVRCKMNDMLGPVLLITVGTMWLLSNFTHSLRFLTFLAVVFIVLGAVKLLQGSASTEGHIPPGTMPAGTVPPVPPVAANPSPSSTEVQNG